MLSILAAVKEGPILALSRSVESDISPLEEAHFIDEVVDPMMVRDVSSDGDNLFASLNARELVGWGEIPQQGPYKRTERSGHLG